MDRHRQDWLHKGCDKSALSDATQCPSSPVNASFTPQVSMDGLPNNIVDNEMNGVAQTGHIQSTEDHSAMHGEWCSTACINLTLSNVKTYKTGAALEFSFSVNN
jgi:hypothetical protein